MRRTAARRATRSERRKYVRGVSSAATYSPLTDPELDLIEWWTARAGLSLTGSLINSVTGQKAGYQLTATSTLRPSYGATSITDPGGKTHAGIIFGGSHGLVCTDAAFKAAMHALSASHFVIGLQSNTPASLQTIVEWGSSWFSATGLFGIFLNDTVSSTLEVGNRGAGAGLGIRRSNAGTVPLIDPGVIQVDLGGSSAGSTAQTLDGVQLLVTDPGSGSAYSSGVYATADMHVGSRAESSLFLYANLADLFICGPNATASALRRVRAYSGRQIGAVQG